MNFLEYLIRKGQAKQTTHGIEISNDLSVQNLNLMKKSYEREMKEQKSNSKKKKEDD